MNETEEGATTPIGNTEAPTPTSAVRDAIAQALTPPKVEEPEAKTEEAPKEEEPKEETKEEAKDAEAEERADRLRHADYTKKTQALAEERKAFEATLADERAKLDQERQEFEKLLAKALDEGYEAVVEAHPRFRELSEERDQAMDAFRQVTNRLFDDLAGRVVNRVNRQHGVSPEKRDVLKAMGRLIEADGLDGNDLAIYTPEFGVRAYEEFVVGPELARQKRVAPKAEPRKDESPPPPPPPKEEERPTSPYEATRKRIADALGQSVSRIS
ncbi:MAG: hypothetical protein KIS66_16780 [Fimbriimonadaceae bacterium]|nr:hypothetical protein [Fimbriimonadaceae bacterium]